jgi:hypothetical protein
VKTPGVNLHELLRRLGVRGGAAQPEMLEGVVPVSIFSEHADLASPVLPPKAALGCNFGVTATRFGVFDLVSKAAGGLVIETCAVGTPTAGGCQFRFAIASPGAFAAIGFPNAGFPVDMASDPVASTSRFGENAASVLTFTTFPAVFAQQMLSVRLPEQIYVAPGRQFVIEASTVSASFAVAMVFRELPAIASHPSL